MGKRERARESKFVNEPENQSRRAAEKMKHHTRNHTCKCTGIPAKSVRGRRGIASLFIALCVCFCLSSSLFLSSFSLVIFFTCCSLSLFHQAPLYFILSHFPQKKEINSNTSFFYLSNCVLTRMFS